MTITVEITLEMLTDKFGYNGFKEAVCFVDNIIKYIKPTKPVLLNNASSSMKAKYLSELKDYELSNSKYEALKNKNISILSDYLRLNGKGIYYVDFDEENCSYVLGVYWLQATVDENHPLFHLLDTKEACEEFCKQNNDCLKKHGLLKI